MDIYKKQSQSEVTRLKDRFMVPFQFNPGYTLKSPIRNTTDGHTLTIDFTQLGFNIGQVQNVVELTNFLFGLMQGIKCTSKPENLEYFLHHIGDQLDINRGSREDLKFLELMWLNKQPHEIVFDDKDES